MENSIQEKNLVFDLPVKYKKLEIYPVLMKDYYDFHFLVQSIILEKNSVPDVEVISMTYLNFMYKNSSKQKPYAFMFRELLAVCLRIEPSRIIVKYDEDSFEPIFLVDDERYDSKDFEEIKKIICEQNLVDIPNEKIQKEIRDKIEEARKLREKISGGNKMGSLEDLVIAVVISTSLKIEDIYNLSIRKFNKILQRLDHTMHYKIYLTASMSGMVKFKDENFIKHWLANLEKDELEGVTVGLEEIKGQLSFENIKK